MAVFPGSRIRHCRLRTRTDEKESSFVAVIRLRRDICALPLRHRARPRTRCGTHGRVDSCGLHSVHLRPRTSAGRVRRPLLVARRVLHGCGNSEVCGTSQRPRVHSMVPHGHRIPLSRAIVCDRSLQRRGSKGRVVGHCLLLLGQLDFSGLLFPSSVGLSLLPRRRGRSVRVLAASQVSTIEFRCRDIPRSGHSKSTSFDARSSLGSPD